MAYRELGFGGRDLLASVEREQGREQQRLSLWLAFFRGKEKGNGYIVFAGRLTWRAMSAKIIK